MSAWDAGDPLLRRYGPCFAEERMWEDVLRDMVARRMLSQEQMDSMLVTADCYCDQERVDFLKRAVTWAQGGR